MIKQDPTILLSSFSRIARFSDCREGGTSESIVSGWSLLGLLSIVNNLSSSRLFLLCISALCSLSVCLFLELLSKKRRLVRSLVVDWAFDCPESVAMQSVFMMFHPWSRYVLACVTINKNSVLNSIWSFRSEWCLGFQWWI